MTKHADEPRDTREQRALLKRSLARLEAICGDRPRPTAHACVDPVAHRFGPCSPACFRYAAQEG
jgi:hypothetical protein